MPLLEAVRLALSSLWASKLKSGFALAGVFIGVTFLIAVVSIVEGMNTYMTERVAGTLLGVNTFQLRQRPEFNLGNTPVDVRRRLRRRPRITYGDAEAVARGITIPVRTAWQSSTRLALEHEGLRAADIEIIAASEAYFDIKGLQLAQGRAFSPQEVRAGAPVLVLGWELADRLFEGRDPLGRQLRIRGVPYRVIGVVERQGTLFGISLDKFGVAPATSPLKQFINPHAILDGLLVEARSLGEMRTAMGEAEAIMRGRRRLRPTQENNFTLETSDAVLDFWAKINRVLYAALPGLVSISLVVSGIVIMNIMLIGVADRTAEIGLRMALGARRRDILHQVLVESSTLATLGAALGVAAGAGLAAFVDTTTPLPTTVAPWSVVVSILLGGSVGIVSGVYPAVRASRLDPIAALRHE